MFLPKSVISTIIGNNTNAKLLLKGVKQASMTELLDVVGIELAMSTLGGNRIADFWSTKRYVGNSDIASTMPRDRFSSIRGCLRIYPDISSSPEIHKNREIDPLWVTRPLLKDLLSTYTSIAVPT